MASAVGNGETTTRKRRPERVEEIVDAAVALFHERGYQATSLADVANEIGLAAPSLYRHVDSKARILELALKQVSDVLLGRVEQIVSSGAPPEEVLTSLICNLIDVIVEQPQRAAVLMRERHNLAPPMAARFERAQRMHVEEWVHVLAQIRPDLRDSEARLMVRAVLAMLDGSADLVHDVGPGDARAILLRMSRAALLGPPTRRATSC